jgi:hypothetical protein
LVAHLVADPQGVRDLCQLDVADPDGPDQLGVRRTDHKVGVSLRSGRRGGDRISARPVALGPLALHQPAGADARQPAQPRREARSARLAAGHSGQERGEGLGLDVGGLARAGLQEQPDGPTQPGFVDHGVAHPRPKLGSLVLIGPRHPGSSGACR